MSGEAQLTAKALDDAMVDALAVAMKAKLAQTRAKGRGGWQDPAACSVRDLWDMLVEHAHKPNLDMVDVAAFAGMLRWRMANVPEDRAQLAVHIAGRAFPGIAPSREERVVELRRRESELLQELGRVKDSIARNSSPIRRRTPEEVAARAGTGALPGVPARPVELQTLGHRLLWLAVMAGFGPAPLARYQVACMPHDHPGNTERALRELVGRGLLHLEDGRYALTPAGAETADQLGTYLHE